MSKSNNSAPTTRGRPKGSGAQSVYQAIRDDILLLKLGPGAHIDESAQEIRFKVSRTPVREALIRLAADGLVTLLPNRGAQVSQLDISDVPQFFEALDLCQRLVMRFCAARRTDEDVEKLMKLNREFEKAAAVHDVVEMTELNHYYHVAMANACGNKYIRSLYEELLSVGLRLARSAFTTGLQEHVPDRAYYEEVVSHHEQMITAIRERDADGCEKLARAHTNLFRQRILRTFDAPLARDIDLREAVRQFSGADR